MRASKLDFGMHQIQSRGFIQNGLKAVQENQIKLSRLYCTGNNYPFYIVISIETDKSNCGVDSTLSGFLEWFRCKALASRN